MSTVLRLGTAALLVLSGLLGVGVPAQGGGPVWTTTEAQAGAYYGWSATDIGDVNGDGYGDVMVGGIFVGTPGNYTGSVFVFHGDATGIDTTPDWRADGDLPSTQFGKTVAGIGDVNGDGIDDVAVAAPGYGGGAVFVWYGSETTGLNGGTPGTVANADWRADGIASNAQLGHSIAATDVDGNGINDLIAGAPGYSNDPTTFDEGAVFIWYGSESGLGDDGTPANADWMAEGDFLSGRLGTTLVAGHLNDDEYGDLAMGALQAPGYDAYSGYVWVVRGEAGGLTIPGLGAATPVGGGDANDRYGHAMAAGDFDFDGIDELAVGIPGYTETLVSQGAVAVLKGTSAVPVWFRIGASHNEEFGKSLAAGKHDGDPFEDLLVGSPTWTDFVAMHSGAGQVNLFPGSKVPILSQEPVWSFSGNENIQRVGWAVAMVDVNGDGASELLVSTPHDDDTFIDQGVAWIWPGVPGETTVQDDCITPTPDLTIEAPVTGRYRGHFGRVVANAGDVNGDGVDDVIVSGPNYGTEGVVFVFHGRAPDAQGVPGGLDPTPAFTFSDPSVQRLGIGAAAAGDVDGNGYDDIIVSATGWGTGYQYIPGGVWLFFGEEGGLDPQRVWTATSPITPDQFGFAATGVGDIDHDGYDDIMVGAIGYEKVFSHDPHRDILPRVYLWYGGPDGPAGGIPGTPGNADWYTESDQIMDGLGRSIAAAGDLDNDSFDEVVLGAPFRDFGPVEYDRGIVWVYRGSGTRRNQSAPGSLGDPGDADFSLIGVEDYENFGMGLSSADLDDDDDSDLIIGAPGASGAIGPRQGRVTVIKGQQFPLDPRNRSEVMGDRPYADFGFTVVGTRDANGDGIDDYLVGAWNLSNDRHRQGRAYLYLGDPVSLPLSPQWQATGSEAGELMGAGLAGADVNADGIADIVVGSPYYELPPNNESGLLSVWHGGSETALTATPGLVHAGETLRFQHTGGRPFAPVLLAVVDVSGVPTLGWIALEALDAYGCWSFSLTVPAGVAGFDFTFATLTLGTRGGVISSNPVVIESR